MVAEDIIAIEKNMSILNRDKKKDALRTFQKSARPHLFQAQGCKSINLSFENMEIQDPLLKEDCMIPRDSFHQAPPSRISKSNAGQLLLVLTVGHGDG